MELYTRIIKFLAFACCAVFVFLIPFGWQSANYILGSFALFAVINPEFWKNFKTTKLTFAEKAVLAATATYLLWELVTMFWTYNTDRGMTVITRHLPLFAMPCLLVIAKIGGIIKRPGVMMQVFCLGVLVSMVICLILSYYDCHYISHGDKVFDVRLPDYRDRSLFEVLSCGYSFFSYYHLSHFDNPHYLATFINVVLMVIYINLYQCGFKFWRVVILAVLTLFCVGFLYLLCNRANYIAFAVIVCVIAGYEFFAKKHRVSGAVIVIGIALFASLMFGSGRGQDMLEKMQRALIEGQTPNENLTEEENLEHINSRTVIWKSATRLIAKHPILGSGVGDTMDALVGQYFIDGYLDTGYQGFNSHNQYFDTWIGLGIVGVLLLLSILAVAFMAGIKYGFLPLVLYGITLAVGFITEVMFTHSIGDFTITFIMMLMIMSAIECFNRTNGSTIPVERT